MSHCFSIREQTVQ